MKIDPKKIREIASVCAILSKSAPTAEEHGVFANPALKWLTIALDRETRLAIDLDRYGDDGDAPSVSVTAEGPAFLRSTLGGTAIGKQKACERVESEATGIDTHGFRILSVS